MCIYIYKYTCVLSTQHSNAAQKHQSWFQHIFGDLLKHLHGLKNQIGCSKLPHSFMKLVVLFICLWYVSRGIHEVLNRFRCPFKNCYATSCGRCETSWNLYSIYIYTHQLNAFTHTYTYTHIYIHIFSCSLPETLKLPSYHHSLHVLVNMHLMLSQPVSATGGSICSLVSWWFSSPLAPRVETTEKDPEVVPGSGGSDPSGRSLLYGSMKKTRGCFRK